MNRRPILLSILLAALVLLILMRQDDGPIQIVEPQLFKDKFYIQNFEAKGFDIDGKLNQIVNGDRLNQPVTTLDNHLSNPKVVLIEDGKPRWELTAQEGWMDANHEKASLSGELHLQQLEEDRLSLDTEHVDLDLLSKKVSTEDTVVLNQNNGSTEGTGMEADLPGALFQFKSDVKSVYEP